MRKGYSYDFKGTRGDLIETIRNLPSKPNKAFLEEWTDITTPGTKAYDKNKLYINKRNGLKIHFDHSEPGANGFKGKDHYHIRNPNGHNAKDMYLDKDGNPVAKGSPASHILINKD